MRLRFSESATTALAVVLAGFLLTGCGGGSDGDKAGTTSPTAPSQPGTGSGGRYFLTLLGAGTVSFNGTTYRDPALFSQQVPLPPGTYVVEGNLRATLGASVTFGLISDEASVVPGSMRVVSGPVVQGTLNDCGVTFGVTNVASTAFRLSFQTQQGKSGRCVLP